LLNFLHIFNLQLLWLYLARSSSELSQISSLYAKMKNMSRIRKQVGQTILYQQLQILRFLELGIPTAQEICDPQISWIWSSAKQT